MEKTYIFNDTEVKLTGRTGEKVVPATGRAGSKPKVNTIYEVTPVDPETGSWKKFVRMNDLYEVKEKP